MTQDHCLASAHHFTYEGTCYPGNVANLGLTSVGLIRTLPRWVICSSMC